LVSLAVLARWRLSARLSNSTASSSANGGHAATATANTLNARPPQRSHNDKQIPSTNANHRPSSTADRPQLDRTFTVALERMSLWYGISERTAERGPGRGHLFDHAFRR
jgi:hypothetical protein